MGQRDPPILLPGDDRWRVADALEWLRRHGIEGVHHRRESQHYVFFEKFERHWGNKDATFVERRIAEVGPGILLVYREYVSKLDPATLLDPNEVAGGKRIVRCFKFFHDQKNYGPPFSGEVAYGKRKQPAHRGELA